MTRDFSPNTDRQETNKFSAMAEYWWDPKGRLRALHEINPTRMQYIRRGSDLKGRQVLDVGCGGGLLSEALAASGAHTTGIDMSAKMLVAASQHAVSGGLHIDYQQSSAEQWALDHSGIYDVVTCMELLEHVPDPASLVQACSALARPGADIYFATVNRTWLARLLVIWASENVLGLMVKGTHRYEKFVRPDELIAWGRLAGLTLADLSGMRYIPYLGITTLCKDVRMNYLVQFKKDSPCGDGRKELEKDKSR